MELRRKKVLVIGGAGFVGSHLCEKLLLEGAEVGIFDNFSTGKVENLNSICSEIKVNIEEGISRTLSWLIRKVNK